MLTVLRNPTFAKLYMAQVVALLGTGLMTIALALLAFDLAGSAAGVVLGTALTIKMVVYVGLAPMAQALTARLNRRRVLIGADIVRASVALSLPFVDAVWHVYVLVFVLQAASATFTPTFQATIPDILPDEADYTRALSLSRMAYELENIASPILAGLLLAVINFHWLFLGTFTGFLLSAVLVYRTILPATQSPLDRPFRERLTVGTRIYLGTPRLRGLLGLNLAVAASSAFVIVNTVVLAKGEIWFTQAMVAFGLGAIMVAVLLPRVLDRIEDRSIMLGAATGLTTVLACLGSLLLGFTHLPVPWIFAIWFLLGAMGSMIMTPSARLLRRSAHSADRPAVFTAQFALSHACWLITYPLAGWVGATFGLPASAGVLAILAATGAALARRFWPAHTRDPIIHDHRDLAPDHPHMKDNHGRHSHSIVIDDAHPVWPGKT